MNLSQNKKIGIGILIIIGVLLYIIFKHPSDKGADSKLQTEQALLKQNAELMKMLIQESRSHTDYLEKRIEVYENQLLQKKAEVSVIKKQGNEKIIRAGNYNADDISKYLSGLNEGLSREDSVIDSAE